MSKELISPEKWLKQRDLTNHEISHPMAGEQYVQRVSDAMRMYAREAAQFQQEWIDVKTPPKTQDDGKEYVVRAIKSTDDEIIRYYLCWYSDDTWFRSDGRIQAFDNNADFMYITHYKEIVEPLPTPPNNL